MILAANLIYDTLRADYRFQRKSEKGFTMWNNAMRQTFAQQGYIIIPDVLNQAQLDALNNEYDQRTSDYESIQKKAGTDKQNRYYLGDRSQLTSSDRHGNTYSGRRFWNKSYMDLIDNETMLPIIEEVLGDPSWGHAPAHTPPELRSRFRLDHDNIHYKPGRTPHDGPDKGGTLHGNPGNFHITCVYELKTVKTGDGGFGCVPGSHKPNTEQRLTSIEGDWRSNWCNTEWTNRLPNWPDDLPVHHVEAKAGDCILFTEKLKHGTIPWSSDSERRTLFYKYVPYGMHHGDVAYDTTDPELTDRQKRILEFSPAWFNEPREDKDYSANPSLTQLHSLAQIESDPSILQPGMAPPQLRLSEETKRALINE